MKKIDYIRIRLTSKEKEEIRTNASAVGMTITDYILSKTIGKPSMVKPKVDKPSIVKPSEEPPLKFEPSEEQLVRYRQYLVTRNKNNKVVTIQEFLGATSSAPTKN